MKSRLTSQTGSVQLRSVVVMVAAATAAVAFGAVGYASPGSTAAQAQYAPQNTAPPTISGTTRVGETLTTSNGTFTGTAPITYTYQWQRCDTNGGNCVDVLGASSQSYRLQPADSGRTMRVLVAARNASGTSTAMSVPTAVVTTAGPAGQIRLPGGGISIPATSVVLPAQLLIQQVQFTPNPARSRSEPISVLVRVKDTRGYFVRGALVFVRSTPLLTTTPPEQATQTNGTVTLQTVPRANFPLRTGYYVQFFVRARKIGDIALAGVSARRLVQLRTVSP